MDRYTQKLRADILNEKNIVLSSAGSIILKDKYPMAQHHYLVTPRNENIKNLFELSANHLGLLKDMFEVSLKLIDEMGMSSNQFLFGFNRDSSMQVLVMHVISKDFCSDNLKWPRHWTKFHTTIFMPYPVAYSSLQLQGKVQRLTTDELVKSRTATLTCHFCSFFSKSLFSFKFHLLWHWGEELQQRDKDLRGKMQQLTSAVKKKSLLLIQKETDEMEKVYGKLKNVKPKTNISDDDIQELCELFKKLSINCDKDYHVLKKTKTRVFLPLGSHAKTTEQQPQKQNQQYAKINQQQMVLNVKQNPLSSNDKEVDQIKTLEPIISDDVKDESGPGNNSYAVLNHDENDWSVPAEEQLMALLQKDFSDDDSCSS